MSRKTRFPASRLSRILQESYQDVCTELNILESQLSDDALNDVDGLLEQYRLKFCLDSRLFIPFLGMEYKRFLMKYLLSEHFKDDKRSVLKCFNGEIYDDKTYFEVYGVYTMWGVINELEQVYSIPFELRRKFEYLIISLKEIELADEIRRIEEIKNVVESNDYGK